jgi:hypothetical protein
MISLNSRITRLGRNFGGDVLLYLYAYFQHLLSTVVLLITNLSYCLSKGMPALTKFYSR